MKLLRSLGLTNKIATGLFLCYIMIGLFIVRDFGMNWDDDSQHINGLRNIDYLLYHDKEPLRQSLDRYHGPAFEIGLVVIERILRINDRRTLFQMRHTMVFLYCVICLLFFYLLTRKLFDNRWLPLLGCLIFVLHPRIFADSFYNPKDITAMGGMIVGMYTLILLSETLSWRYIFLHAFVSAWCIDIRVICMMLPVVTLITLAYRNLYIEKRSLRKIAILSFAYLVLTFGMMIPMWPILMDGPFHQLSEGIRQMSHYTAHKGLVMYFGKFYRATEAPGHYQFVWFFITTPVIYSLLFLTGIVFLFISLIRGWESLRSDFYIWIALGLFIVPPASMWVAHSLMLNGWRHVFMIYPFFVLVCIYAVDKLINAGAIVRKASIASLVAGLIFNLGMICYMHPFEFSYFNPLAVECLAPIDRKFETEYYGPSFKQGLEYLLKNCYHGAPLRVIVSNYPGRLNYVCLSPADQAKIIITEQEHKDEADYYINMHRWDLDLSLNRNLIYEFRRQGNRILSIYKLK